MPNTSMYCHVRVITNGSLTYSKLSFFSSFQLPEENRALRLKDSITILPEAPIVPIVDKLSSGSGVSAVGSLLDPVVVQADAVVGVFSAGEKDTRVTWNYFDSGLRKGGKFPVRKVLDMTRRGG